MLPAGDGVKADTERLALREAAHWLMRLHGHDDDPAERAALARWRASADANEKAWQQAQRLRERLGALPSAVAAPVLARQPDRRQALKALVGIGVLPAAGWLAWQQVPWRAMSADLRTVRGEQRTLQLPDGTSLTLDTASAVDVTYTAEARTIFLRAGAAYLATAQDARPLSVLTLHGSARALGTRFSVALEEAATRVAVAEGAVSLQPLAGEPLVLQAGSQSRFDAHRCDPAAALADGAFAWTQGVLYADRMRLDSFADTVSAYRRGMVRCDPRVAGLRISGSFRLADTTQILDMLAATLPVKVRYHTRYWVEIGPAA